MEECHLKVSVLSAERSVSCVAVWFESGGVRSPKMKYDYLQPFEEMKRMWLA